MDGWQIATVRHCVLADNNSDNGFAIAALLPPMQRRSLSTQQQLVADYL